MSHHAFRLLVALLVGFSGAAAQAARTQPNVIVILVDDLGFGDLSLHGSPDWKTPHIDSLATSGVRCTQGYASCPVCAPTRAGLMTGRYQQRFGLEFNPAAGGKANVHGLPRDQIALPELLGSHGYVTGMVGKWHLGGTPGLRPSERGYGEFFGFLEGASKFFPATTPPGPGVIQGAPGYQQSILRGVERVDEPEYLTDAFTREALAFVERHQQAPFFLYLAYNAVHSPLEAPQKYLDRVPGVGPPRRKIYGAMLTAMDDGIGRLLAKLRELKLEEETLIFFLSDNGGAPQPYNTTDNRPFSGKKGTLLEGGIHVPFFVRWPGKLPEGKIYEQPVISLDVFATAAAAAGGKLPTDRVMDGVDLCPFLLGQETAAPHPSLFWRYGDDAAIRRGAWKLLKTTDCPGQLYDLSKDVGETRDLAAQQPDLTQQLEAELASWQAELHTPLWSYQRPVSGNSGWLYDMLGDPQLISPGAASAAPDPNSAPASPNTK